VTMHESAISRMQKEGMTELAAESIRHALGDLDDEAAESLKDITAQKARIQEDELYLAGLDRRRNELRARLAQLEAS